MVALKHGSKTLWHLLPFRSWGYCPICWIWVGLWSLYQYSTVWVLRLIHQRWGSSYFVGMHGLGVLSWHVGRLTTLRPLCYERARPYGHTTWRCFSLSDSSPNTRYNWRTLQVTPALATKSHPLRFQVIPAKALVIEEHRQVIQLALAEFLAHRIPKSNKMVISVSLGVVFLCSNTTRRGA